ncbi:MAG: hypothetical protein ABSD74_04515 [Rhizomicrobium sp.]|jgi:hypothetical protein
MAAYYRALASEAATHAGYLPASKWRDAYQKIAAHWTQLADEIDDDCRAQLDIGAFGGD